MNNKSDNILNLKRDVFYASLFFIFCSLFSLTLVNLSRLGLDVPSSLNVLIITIIIKIGLSPFWFSFDKKDIQNNFIYIKFSFSILLSFLLIFLGFLSPYVYYFFALVLILFSIYKLKNLIGEIDFKLLIVLFIFSSFLVANYIPLKIEYFYSPEITLYGLGGNQTMQGAAITNIFKNYNAISLGADGTENFLYKYHYGLYIWWSSISLISNTNSLFVIPFTQQAILIPMIFFATYISSLAFLKNSLRISLLILTIFSFILFDIFSGKLYYDSETYTSSLIFLILLIPIIKYLIENNKNDKNNLLISLILIFFIPLISSLKLTTGYLFCILIASTFFYKRNYKINYFFIILTVLFGVLSLTLFMPSSYTGLAFWRLYSSYGQLFLYQNFFSIVLPSIFLLNLFYRINFMSSYVLKRRQKKNFYKKIFRWLFNKQATYQKIALIAYFGSILPIFIIPVGSTAVYNIVHLHWIFLVLALSFLVNNSVFNLSKKKLFISSFILVFFVILMKPSSIHLNTLESFFEKTLNIEINGAGKLKNIIFSNIKKEKKIFSDLQLENINQNSLNKILNKAISYNRIYKKDFAIYIPKRNSGFWEIIRRNNLPYWCSSTTFLIPALTGLQMLKGVQDPSLCETYYVAGPSEYSKNTYLDNLDINKICIHAKKKKINYIYQINDIANIKSIELIDCKLQ